jgi:hypothetical protein
MFLSSKAALTPASSVGPGEYIAAGGADGEDIPYGKPYCVFVAGKNPARLKSKRGFKIVPSECHSVLNFENGVV